MVGYDAPQGFHRSAEEVTVLKGILYWFLGVRMGHVLHRDVPWYPADEMVETAIDRLEYEIYWNEGDA